MKSFSIKGKVWTYPADAAWHFVYVNKELSQQIRDTARNLPSQTGEKKTSTRFVRVRATVGKTSWSTSLFPTKDGPYLLALKADVRQKENITEGDTISAVLTFL